MSNVAHKHILNVKTLVHISYFQVCVSSYHTFFTGNDIFPFNDEYITYKYIVYMCMIYIYIYMHLSILQLEIGAIYKYVEKINLYYIVDLYLLTKVSCIHYLSIL